MILIFRSRTKTIKIGLIGVLILTTISLSCFVHARTDLPIQLKSQKKAVRVLYSKNEILPRPSVTIHVEYHGIMKDYTVPQDTVGNTLNRLHIKLGENDVMGWELSDMITDDQTIVITKIEYKVKTREEIIPFETEKIKADDMLIGETKIVQQGQNGLKSCIYQNSYFNDRPWHSFKKSESIITPAVNEVIKTGTQNILEIQNVDLKNEDSVLLKTKVDDANFKLPQVKLSEHDRDLLERLLTGEFGGSFTGAALVAQAIKCAIVYDHYTSMDDLIIGMGYVGDTDCKSQNAVDAAKYIFDENALAVKHRLFYMCTEDYYNSDPGNFHSTQNFILQYENVKFFDRWKRERRLKMATDKKEKLQKILEQIERENAVIDKAKDNIKRLNAQKKKLEKAIQDDEFAIIRSSLEESGITSVEDFNRVFPNADISQNPKNGEDSSLDPIL